MWVPREERAKDEGQRLFDRIVKKHQRKQLEDRIAQQRYL
jgi:hypothetical protein